MSALNGGPVSRPLKGKRVRAQYPDAVAGGEGSPKGVKRLAIGVTSGSPTGVKTSHNGAGSIRVLAHAPKP